MNNKKPILTLGYDYEEEDVEFEYEFFHEELGFIVKKRFPTGCAYVAAEDVGWRRMSADGYIKFDIDEKYTENVGINFLRDLKPKTSECTIQVYKYKKGLYLNIKHHDNPVNGDRYFLTPCAESTYLKHNS